MFSRPPCLRTSCCRYQEDGGFNLGQYLPFLWDEYMYLNAKSQPFQCAKHRRNRPPRSWMLRWLVSSLPFARWNYVLIHRTATFFYVPNTAEINHPVLKLLRNFRNLKLTVDLRCLLSRLVTSLIRRHDLCDRHPSKLASLARRDCREVARWRSL